MTVATTVAIEDGGTGREGDLVRSLGVGERILPLFVPEQPLQFCILHLCMVCELAGPTAVGDDRAAFDRVQARHPFLAASIQAGAPGRIRRSDRPIAASVLPRANAPDLERVAERELSSRFPDREGRMRATVLHAAEGATIVLGFRYTLSDGLSGVHDLMQAVAGEPLAAPRDLPKAA